MRLLGLYVSQLIVLIAWLFIGLADASKGAIQVAGLIQCLAYALIISNLFIRHGLYYCLPWFLASGIWFFFSDIVLGNFVASEKYVALVCLYTSGFVFISTVFYGICSNYTFEFFNKKFFNPRYSIITFRFAFLMIPLVIQFILAHGSIEKQFEMLFAGRASGVNFWGDDIPHYLRTFLAPISYVFNMSASLFAAKILQKRTITSLINFIPILFVLVVAFANGSRNIFLLAFGPLALILFSYLRSAKSKLILVVLIAFLLPPIMQYQVSNRGLFDFQAGTFRNNADVIGGNNILSMHRDNNIDIFASAAKSRDTGFLQSTDYTAIIISSMQILPRAIFTFKPKSDTFDYHTGGVALDPGYLSMFAFNDKVTASLSLTLPGDFYYADSHRGLLIGALIAGILLRIGDWLSLSFRASFDRDSAVILQSFVVYVALFSFRSYGGIFVYGVPLILVYFGTIFLDKSRQLIFRKTMR
jgi:hypothetical protein